METDITTYVNGQKVESFNIDGKTCIFMDDLAPYGEVVWVPEVRALKMWIEDLPMQTYTAVQEAPVVEQLGLACYDGTDIPKYDSATGSTFDRKTSLMHDTLWYKSDFHKYSACIDLLRQCGYNYASKNEIEYETYIDKNNTFRKREKSYRSVLRKGYNEIDLTYYFTNFTNDEVAITIY